MQNEPFIIETIYRTTIENVWNALTNSQEMRQWYFDVPGFRAEPGYEFHFSSSPGEERLYRHDCQVTELKHHKKLAFTWKYSRYKNIITLVTFELSEEPDGSTRLRLTHEGLEGFPDSDPDFSKNSFEEGWTWIVKSALKDYIEKTYRPMAKKVKLEVQH